MSAVDRTTANISLDTNITTNGNKEITGAILNSELKQINDSIAFLIDEAHMLGIREYDPLKTYKIGQGAFFLGGIYQANIDNISGVFDSLKWTLLVQITDPTAYDFAPYDNATTYNIADRVLFQNRFFICDQNGTVGILPDDSVSEWTEVSASEGVFGAPWVVGYYLDTQVVSHNGFLYKLTSSTPPSFNSTDIASEITGGDWELFHNTSGSALDLAQVLTNGNVTGGFKEIIMESYSPFKFTHPFNDDVFLEVLNQNPPTVRLSGEVRAFVIENTGASPNSDHIIAFQANLGGNRIINNKGSNTMTFKVTNLTLANMTNFICQAVNPSFTSLLVLAGLTSSSTATFNGIANFNNTTNFDGPNNFSMSAVFNALVTSKHKVDGTSNYVSVQTTNGGSSYTAKYPDKTGTQIYAFTDDIPFVPIAQLSAALSSAFVLTGTLSIITGLTTTLTETTNYEVIISGQATLSSNNTSLEIGVYKNASLIANTNRIMGINKTGGGTVTGDMPFHSISLPLALTSADVIDVRGRFITGAGTIESCIFKLNKLS